MISVVYRFFRPQSYFHARDNWLTVTSSSRQTFSKHLFWYRQWCKGQTFSKLLFWTDSLISWKLPSDICCLSFAFRPFWTGSDPIFTRETIGWLWRSSSQSNFFKTFILDRQWCNCDVIARQTFSKHLFSYKLENYRVISVVYRLFRPGSYFHARDNSDIFWLWRHRHLQTFSKHLFWTGSCDARCLISGKLPSDICCLSFFSSSNPIFTRETIGWLWRNRHVKLFQNIYFGGRRVISVVSSMILFSRDCWDFIGSYKSYKWKITEWYLLFIVCFVQHPIFTRETIDWLWRHRGQTVQTFFKTFILDRLQWCKVVL